MNIRNYISNDHVMSVNEIATTQARMIQLLTIEINDKDKKIDKLKKQLETYKKVIKEAINRIEYTNFKDVEDLEKFKSYFDNLMNIINKVGGSE